MVVSFPFNSIIVFSSFTRVNAKKLFQQCAWWPCFSYFNNQKASPFLFHLMACVWILLCGNAGDNKGRKTIVEVLYFFGLMSVEVCVATHGSVIKHVAINDSFDESSSLGQYKSIRHWINWPFEKKWNQSVHSIDGKCQIYQFMKKWLRSEMTSTCYRAR